MIALDTNVLVRLLVADDEAQQEIAWKLLLDTAARGERCLIPNPVLCELAWVLESCFNASRTDLLAAAQRLLEQEQTFCFEDRKVVQRAVEAFANGRGDLADHLIGETARKAGARTTYTFDRALRGSDNFSWLSARDR